MLENFRSLRKFSIHEHLGFGYSSRQGAKNAKFGQKILFLFLCGLCVFAGDIPIVLVAASPH
jgi:hypothetical protein